jgi:hypothetical protein
VLVAAAATARSGPKEALPPATTVATLSVTDAPIPDTASPFDGLPESVRLAMDKPFTGDVDCAIVCRSLTAEDS